MFSPSKLQNKRPAPSTTENGPRSPSKLLASPLQSLKTLLWSPSKESTAKENEESNPTPSKRLKRDVEQCSSLITSSPQRNNQKAPAPSVTPKKKPVRNLNAEFSASENKEVPEDFQIFDDFAVPNPIDNKENLKQSRTQQILNTLFSPVFKQYHHLFGLTHTHTHTQTITTPTTQIERVEKSQVCQIVKLPEEEEYSTQNAYLQLSVVELASNETLSDSPERKGAQNWAIQEETETDEVEQFEEDEEEEFDPYAFIAGLPPINPEFLIRPKALPSRGATPSDITLVLDLDETLVHCSTDPITQAQLTFPVVFNEIEYRVFVRQRPFFKHFLEEVSKKFEVVVFTASQEVYASKLLDIIDPEKKLIHHRLYRQSCINVEGNFLKDLNILGRDLSKVVIVDNSPQTFGYQIDNGIPIESWFEDPEDRELLNLLPFLSSLEDVDDVRPHIRRKYNLHKKIEQVKTNMYNKSKK